MRKRLYWFTGFLSVLLAVILVRLVYLSFFQGRKVEKIVSTAMVERGTLYDRNGKILAIQQKQYSVSVWKPNITNLDSLSASIAPILGLSAVDIAAKITESKSNYVFIQRKITEDQQQKIRALIQEKKVKGILLEPEFGRTYPQKELAASLIGYVDTDNIGIDGVELGLNDMLMPQKQDNGILTNGNDIYLTIDINLQYFLEEAAAAALKEHGADYVTILLAKGKTGEILANATVPSFNPNNFSKYSAEERQNRAAVIAYEPGSVFKVFSMAALLEEGAITPDSEVYCNGYYEKVLNNGEKIKIACLNNHGTVTPRTIIKYSCNAGAAYSADNISDYNFRKRLAMMGFGLPTGLPVPGESSGILNELANWSLRSRPTIAMGQEISISAYQIIKAATALTNGGDVLRPTLIKKVVSGQGRSIAEQTPQVASSPLSPQTAKEILSYMNGATESGGTARKVFIEGLDISAKTGTAQVRDPKTGKYSDTNFIASVLCIFPTSDPEYILYIMISNPQGYSYYGGQIATPIAHNLIEKIVEYEGLPLAAQTVYTHPGKITIENGKFAEIGSVMPDLTGMPKKYLLPLLDRTDIQVIIKGNGWVKTQSPAPGKPVPPGSQIVLELE